MGAIVASSSTVHMLAEKLHRDAKTLVRWTLIILDYYHPYPGGAGFTCQYPALDPFYSGGGVVSHMQGFPTFQVLANTRVPTAFNAIIF
jgi:hypothetical protein